jgi:membrane protein
MNFDYKDFFKRLREKINADDILGNSAQVAFYFTFALFPLLLFLMTLLGIILQDKQDLQNQLYKMLGEVMPGAAFELVQKTLQEVTSHASGGKLALGVLTTLWAASAGIDNMRGTLNEVYDLKETRGWFKAKLTSLLLTLGIGVMILVTIGFVAYGTKYIDSILPFHSVYLMEGLQWVVVLCLLLLAFALVYNFAPNHSPFQWKWISPGSVVGVFLWIVLSGGFRLYLHFFNSYAATYGSLGAVIILLLWLYLTAFVILTGGAINAILDEKTGIKKEADDPKQRAEEKAGTTRENKAG